MRSDTPKTHEALRQASEEQALAVVLVRHGQTAFNAARRAVGRLDVPLDERGREQVSRLRDALAEVRFEAVYSSPLSRARDTAAPFGAPVTIPDLSEFSMGELEGIHESELRERFPAFFDAWRSDPSLAIAPGGETLLECQERAMRALGAILSRHARASSPELPGTPPPPGPILIVSHQLVLASILCGLRGLPLQESRHHMMHNTGITVLAFRPEQPENPPSLLSFDDHAHLTDLGGSLEVQPRSQG